MKKLLWFLAYAVVFMTTLTAAVPVSADGNPAPICPNGKAGCKPM